ncbi:hypothetical protein Ocin01_04698 [Orchesella cincta]|uniref:Uncharacterized protein n=1 Tax=Orchesella cincta TaxID=48709 RepID=A0A1D2NAH5_ORCCI|nr:hypothetical protein Ocin01_04698 [Orchesella cincta]
MPHNHRSETLALIHRRSTMKSRPSHRDNETDSVLLHEIVHEFGPCTLCRINLELGVRIFAVVHAIYCVIVLTVHYVELMNVLGIIDADFKYMIPAKREKDVKGAAENMLGFEEADGRKVKQSWVPTVLNCVTDSLQLFAGILIIPATFRSNQKYCGVWLIATYLLYFPHMFYFGFAIAIGTSWISLLIQIFDSLLYTPYAIWIVRAYMDSLGSLKDPDNAPPPPTPETPVPTSPPHHHSSIHSHSHLEVIKEKRHVSHSDQSQAPTVTASSSVTDHEVHKPKKSMRHGSDPSVTDHEVRKPKKSMRHGSDPSVHGRSQKASKRKVDGFDELTKRLGM